MSELERRAVAAYLGLAIGDALGATVEFMTPREIKTHFGVHRKIVGGGWLKLRPGQVTDDTTMALALGDSVLANGGRVDSLMTARAFDGWMRAKPVDIGNTVRRGIVHFRHTGLPQVPFNEHDAGNGACMRVLPVALATFGGGNGEVDAITQARVTHNHPLSDAGTCTVVAMIQAMLGGASKLELLHDHAQRLAKRHSEFNFRQRREDNPSGFIGHTLRVVFQAFFDTNTFEECLIEAVNRGGDADTTGAIAGMIAGACYGRDAIPEHWAGTLETPTRQACEKQARELLALSPACRR
jgi:ADP-ribosyl-[dinitrogen reductase] hydrolase